MPVYAGQIVRAGDGFTQWTPFTPDFQLSAIGDGTVQGEWRRVGDQTIDVRAQLTVGSTTSVGTLGLEVPAGLLVDGALTRSILTAWAWDSSASTGYVGVMVSQTGGGALLDRAYGPSTTGWNATAPFTWATGDQLVVSGTLRITT